MIERITINEMLEQLGLLDYVPDDLACRFLILFPVSETFSYDIYDVQFRIPKNACLFFKLDPNAESTLNYRFDKISLNFGGHDRDPGAFVSCVHTGRPYQCEMDLSSYGQTIYIGSKQSDQRFRIYDKFS